MLLRRLELAPALAQHALAVLGERNRYAYLNVWLFDGLRLSVLLIEVRFSVHLVLAFVAPGEAPCRGRSVGS